METSKNPAGDVRWAPLRQGRGDASDAPVGKESPSVGDPTSNGEQEPPAPPELSAREGSSEDPTRTLETTRRPPNPNGTPSDETPPETPAGLRELDAEAEAAHSAETNHHESSRGEESAATFGEAANRDVEDDSGPPPPEPTQVSDPVVGQVIDSRYRILSKMATGGMASVYVARDQRLDRLVALKLMHPHLAESAEFVERFRREARSAARISHPGVVPIFDQGVYQGQGYLVMELVEGPDLRSYVQLNSPITLDGALVFLEQILSALASAHRSGVIHRDLKPENVLVAPERNLRIVDFGLARALSEGTLSSTGSILGTVAYLAPEVAIKGTLDARTDLYAVGVMAFELFTGDVPGDQSNPLLVAMSRVNEDIPKPSKSVEWLPSEVDDLVATLTARDASKRPASAAEAFALVGQTRSSLTPEQLAESLPTPIRQSPAVPTLEKDPESTDVLLAPKGTSVLPIEEKVVHTSGSVSMPDEMHVNKGAKRNWVIASVLMLIAILGLGSWWWWAQYGPGAYVEVPELAGQTVEQAEDELTNLGLASYITFEHSDDVAVDKVIYTDPSGGQRAHRNGEVNVVVSKGVLMITVPDLEGISEEEATSSLADKGLKVGEIEQVWSEDLAEGLVISTSPSAEASIPHHEPVNLTVSKGPEPIDVLDWVGKPWLAVKEEVAGLGFAVKDKEQFSDEVEEGLVISQNPEPGETRHRGDTISFTVSLGPEMVEVPNVYGKNADEAVAILEGAGFTVEVNRLAGFFNSVGSQTPRGGQLAKRGSLVELTVV